jgi:hypothetical protein
VLVVELVELGLVDDVVVLGLVELVVDCVDWV